MERTKRPAALRQRAVVAIAVALGIGLGPATARAELAVEEITPDYVAGLAPREGTDAANRVGDEVLVRAAVACARSSDDKMLACWEAKLLAAFDRGNNLQGHCTAGASDFGICVTIGSEIIAIFLAAGADPAAEMNWADLSASFSKADERLSDYVLALNNCALKLARTSCRNASRSSPSNYSAGRTKPVRNVRTGRDFRRNSDASRMFAPLTSTAWR